MTLLVPTLQQSFTFELPGGLMLGESPYLIDVDGPQVFGAPELRRVDRPRPGDHGVIFVGPDLLGAVSITIPVVVLGISEIDVLDNLQALAAACQPVAGYGSLIMHGPRGDWAITGRFNPVDAPSVLNSDIGVVQAIVTFVASDPRYRALVAQQLALQAGVSAGDSGYGFAHGYPIGFASGSGTPSQTGYVTNNGDADASAVITLQSSTALVNPTLTLPQTGDVLAWNMTLQPGQYLVTDTATGRCNLMTNLNDPNTASNASQYLAFPNNADMLRFPAGSTQITLTATSGIGTAQIAWHDTYMF
jgi:hypothetical protein